MEAIIDWWPIALVILAVGIVFASLVFSEDIDDEEVDGFLNSIKEDDDEAGHKS